ncbi:MAG: hypothetical protein NW226_26120 [Microscillaceae bacterium]|nr:hypothetical protein [Microscillaceae bacterium]
MALRAFLAVHCVLGFGSTPGELNEGGRIAEIVVQRNVQDSYRPAGQRSAKVGSTDKGLKLCLSSPLECAKASEC